MNDPERFDGASWPWQVDDRFPDDSCDWLVLFDALDMYVSDACVEGTGAEFAELANAIRGGWSISFKRCAAVRCNDLGARDDQGRNYKFYSPRNTQGRATIIPMEAAMQLADMIDDVLAARKR